MKWAEKDNKRIIPNPFKKDVICPLCKSEVIAKCGKIKVWHWAHKNNEDCDNWGGRETKWHLDWKDNFPIENQEVIIGEHRADVKIKDVVIEFQNTSISLDNIKEREKFYGNMKWILNGTVFAQNLILRDKNSYKSFRWKWPPKTWLNTNCPIYIDMQPLVSEWIEYINTKEDRVFTDNGYIDHTEKKIFLRKQIIKYADKLFLIKKVHNLLPCGGWGKLINKKDFIEGAKNGYYRN